MNLELKDKVVFVSASSRGIGKATALAFLEEGARVMINGRDKKRLLKTYDEFHKMFSGKIDYFRGDITKEEVVQGAKEYIIKKWKKIHVIVPNLGSGKPMKKNQMDSSEWERLFEINLFSVVKLLNIVLPEMKKQKEGSIVVVSSIAGIERTGAPLAYASAKSSLLTLIKNLSSELARSNIRINAVVPGNIYFEGGRWEEILSGNPKTVDNYIRQEVPMKRFGTPEEIADTIVWLASTKSSFTTGSCVIVDGGQTRSY